MSKSRKVKYLIETSALEPALDLSTAKHNKHYKDSTREGALWSSTYIRKEFIRCWFCDFLHMAFVINLCTTVHEGILQLRQEFSIRKIKTYMLGVAQLLQERKADTPRMAAEELISY